MNYNGIIVAFGAVLLLLLAAAVIRIFNRSKTILSWFSFLLKQIGAVLAFILFLDIQLIVMSGSILVVWGAVYYSLSWGESNLTPFWYTLLISLSFIYFSVWLWWTGTKGFYRQFKFRKMKKTAIGENEPEREKSLLQVVQLKVSVVVSFLIPLMVIIGLVMLGNTCFGAITSLLVHNESISFLSEGKSPGMSELSDYYLWHFMELIPQIEVTKTIKWEVPFEYDDKGIGWLLLLFKILMAYIVIARFYIWNKWRKELTT